MAILKALDPEFLGRIRRYRCGSGTLRMNVALSELPRFRCLPGDGIQPGHQSGIVIAPSLDYMEQSWLDARQHGVAALLVTRQPIVERRFAAQRGKQQGPFRRHAVHVQVLDRAALASVFEEDERPTDGEIARALEELAEDYAERGVDLKRGVDY